MGDYVESSPCVVDGVVYVFGQAHGRYFAIDAETGNLKWQYLIWRKRPSRFGCNTQQCPLCSPCYYDGSLYVVQSHFCSRIDAETGTDYWEQICSARRQPYDIGFVSWGSPTFADGKIYIGSYSSSFYVLDAITGDRYSWYETSGKLVSSVSIAYGNAYAGGMNWELFCFQDGGPVRQYDVVCGGPDNPNALLEGPQSSLTADFLYGSTVTLGQPITVTGKLTWTGPLLCHDPAALWVTFTRPDGTTWLSNGMTMNRWLRGSVDASPGKEDGTYEISYVPDMVGDWTVRVWWVGDTYNVGCSAKQLGFKVVAPSGGVASQSQTTLPAIPTGASEAFVYAGTTIAILVAVLTVVWYTRRKH
jgi:hypothetical protein